MFKKINDLTYLNFDNTIEIKICPCNLQYVIKYRDINNVQMTSFCAYNTLEDAQEALYNIMNSCDW